MKVVIEFYRVRAVDKARAKIGHVSRDEISIWENEGGAVARSSLPGAAGRNQ